MSGKTSVYPWRTMMLLAASIFFATVTALVPPSGAQQNQRPGSPGGPNNPSTDEDIHVLPVQNNVYMLVGDGANITVETGEDGVLLVDTGEAAMADKLFATIKTLSDGPIRYIVNTSADLDHIGGNEAIAKHGSTIPGGGNAANQAAVIAYLSVLDRLSVPNGQKSAIPQGGWPTDTFTLDHKDLWFDDQGVRIYHEPAAHTDGDTVVYFRQSDVVSTGEIFSVDSYPVIDLAKGGSIQGELDALNHIIDLAIPAQLDARFGGSEDEGGTLIVPGHGRLCDQSEVVYYQEMVTIIRDRIQDLVKKGLSLEQVKAAKPTLDYDPQYSRTTGPWTTDMFIEAVYKGLNTKQQSEVVR